MALDTFEDIEDLVNELEGDRIVNGVRIGETELRKSFARGDICDPGEAQLVEAWIAREDAKRANEFPNTPEGLARRNTVASERSADASIRAADAATQSAKYAKWAVAISVLALVASIGPSIVSAISK